MLVSDWAKDLSRVINGTYLSSRNRDLVPDSHQLQWEDNMLEKATFFTAAAWKAAGAECGWLSEKPPCDWGVGWGRAQGNAPDTQRLPEPGS